jgi:arylsulfatase A-like enzyme
VLPAASRIGYYEQVPRGTRLIAELGSAAGERARVVFAAANDGERIAFGGADVEGRSVTVSAPLPDLEGPIRLDVENFGGGAVRLHGLRLELPAADPGADLGVPTAEGSPSTRPDVILYLTDTLRADALGAYGAAGDPSPAFDRFASEGLLVEDFRAQSSWTQPAVASILTGLHPGSHGVDEARDVLVPELATLAELLKQAGYATAAFVSNHVVNARRGFTQGFDAWNDDDPSLYGAPAARLVERALAWRDRTEGPAFLYVHTMEPHWPYAPEEEDWRSFRPPDYRGERDPQKLLDRQAELSPGEVAYLRSLYLGAVRQNDRAFAELLDGLEGRGTLDESLVLFTADHGEEFREHGGLMHRFTLYEEVLRIPLAIRFPVAVAGGFRDPGPADQVDLFPSIVGLLGLPAVDDLDGIDHSARWRRAAGAPSPRELIATLHNGRLVRAMIRRGRHKLIAGSDPEAPGVERLELYDLAADPGEQNDLAEDHPIAAAYLERRIRSLQRELALSRERRRAGAELALSEQEAKDLRALGYVE